METKDPMQNKNTTIVNKIRNNKDEIFYGNSIDKIINRM